MEDACKLDVCALLNKVFVNTIHIDVCVSFLLAMNLTLFVGHLCCKNPLQLSPNVPLRPFFCITCVNVKQVVRVM